MVGVWYGTMHGPIWDVPRRWGCVRITYIPWHIKIMCAHLNVSMAAPIHDGRDRRSEGEHVTTTNQMCFASPLSFQLNQGNI